MIPEAIFVFSGGVTAFEKKGKTYWRPTSYEDSDSFGTLGGRDRVLAAALLAKVYPRAYLVTTSRRMNGGLPTLADVYADELKSSGVLSKRIITEEISVNTGSAVECALEIVKTKGWGNIFFLSSEFHLSRIQAFFDLIKSDINMEVVSSESIISRYDKDFLNMFNGVKKTSQYQKRLIAEVNGIKAIRDGKYLPASIKDKKERLV